jgi:hypothetical protein
MEILIVSTTDKILPSVVGRLSLFPHLLIPIYSQTSNLPNLFILANKFSKGLVDWFKW